MDNSSEEDMVRSLRPTVETIARRIALRAPVPLADLIASGMYGALQAVRSFDGSKGCKLTTFATPRIHGQIVDDIRDQMVSRKRMNAVARAVERQQQLMHEQGRDVPLDDLLDEPTRAAKRFGHAMSLNSVADDGDGKPQTFANLIADPNSKNQRVRDRERTEAFVESLMKCLLPREREIVRLYFGGMTMHTIGERVGLCESRVSQMMSALLGKMRDRGASLEHKESGMEVEREIQRTRDNLETLKVEIERRLRSIESDVNILKRINARQGAIDREAHSEAARSEPRDECRAGETAAHSLPPVGKRQAERSEGSKIDRLTKAVRLLAADKDECNERLDQLEERLNAGTIQPHDDDQSKAEDGSASG